MSESDPVYRLVVPAAAAFIATTRIFVAGVATIAGFDRELVDDAKLAVSEVAAAIIAHTDAAEVVVSARLEPGGLDLQIGPWSEQPESDDLDTIELVDVLFPGVTESDVVTIRIAQNDDT